MIDEGADIVDVGGESTGPGHEPVTAEEELARVLPAVAAIRRRRRELSSASTLPSPGSRRRPWTPGRTCSTTSGAPVRTTRWPAWPPRGRCRSSSCTTAQTAEYEDFAAELLADLRSALDRAIELGVRPENLLVDPGFGFGKTPEHNLEIMRLLPDLRALGRPVLLGTSRKSTLGKVLGGLPPEDRLEATLATTALGIAGGVDMIRVHDVLANCRAAKMCDAIVRGGVPL